MMRHATRCLVVILAGLALGTLPACLPEVTLGSFAVVVQPTSTPIPDGPTPMPSPTSRTGQ